VGVATVHVKSWQAAYRGLIADAVLDALDPGARSVTWRDLIESCDWPRQGVWVAIEDGRIRAFVGYCPSRDKDAGPETGEIAAIYAEPSVWGHGVGQALHAQAISELTDAGFSHVTLWVLRGNRRGIRFYERNGWRPDGHAQVVAAEGVELDEIRYRHELTKR
jgi:GNAT superfamily N-acetyltransferase